MILTTALRDVLADAIDNDINAGASPAEFRFETSGDAEVATIILQNPAFGAAATGVITLAGVPLSDLSATGGTVAQVSVTDRGLVKVLEMTCGTGGQEIVISSTAVTATDQVDLTAWTLTVPAT